MEAFSYMLYTPIIPISTGKEMVYYEKLYANGQIICQDAANYSGVPRVAGWEQRVVYTSF